eukprot:CAMPEP_0176230072 /NCGR_PEP_ID=MMETSP0121_2-20121125/24108_1 /TAXON_ID=160619 /ORGANISM="Kryptoperidinium foliaceum, Strain CCMP 1326" /LENGTH=42 /DNA_ID= /DNA_START= /DNA_END= /DNA_ORIENTATION=
MTHSARRALPHADSYSEGMQRAVGHAQIRRMRGVVSADLDSG